MRQFDINIKNKPGALAAVCDVIAKGGINIKAISSEMGDSSSIIKIVTDDETATRKVLQDSRISFNEYEIIGIELIDRPGELARLTKALAEYGVNIESIYLLDKRKDITKLAVKVDHLANAIKALEKMERG